MMSRIFSAALVIALATPCAISSPASASQPWRDEMRPAEHSKFRSVHRHHKSSAQRVTDGRGFYDQPYAGYRTDIGGNRYFYYRVGADTPFGAGRGLRPPYPR